MAAQGARCHPRPRAVEALPADIPSRTTREARPHAGPLAFPLIDDDARYDGPATVKTCPYCAEQILDEAIKCRYCRSMLAPEGTDPLPAAPDSMAGDEQPLQYTHSGRRYLLGYGNDFFGIWDREQPSRPVSRYPRTDDGWRAAWLAFTAREPYSSEVGIGAAGGLVSGTSSVSAAAVTRREVSGAWWLLPIFMGWLGGLIAWLVNKDVDPHRARAMLITGIVVTVVALAVLATLGPPT